MLLHDVPQEHFLLARCISSEDLLSGEYVTYRWVLKPFYAARRDVLLWQVVGILHDLPSADVVDILLDTSAIISVDALVWALLCHSEVVTLFGLPNPFNWVVKLDGISLCLLSHFLELVSINPASNDIRIPIEDAVSLTRGNESSHVGRDLLLVVE